MTAQLGAKAQVGLDRRARRFLDLLAAASRPGALDLSDLRDATAALAAFAAPSPTVERRDERIGGAPGVAVRLYAPPGRGDALLSSLVYFHGGGFVSGGLESHDAICASLSARGDCRVIAVDYRLAPEHRFPAALEDAQAALKAITEDPRRFGVDLRRLGVAGDSAGAGLAVVAACAIEQPLALQLLLCPVMTPLARTRSRAELASGHLIEEATMARYWALYRAEGLSPDDPRVAPLNAGDFSRLPPALVHVAEFDPLRDEGALYVEALRAAGVETTLTVHAGLIHHFYGLGAMIPAGQAGLERIGDDLRRAFAAMS